VVDDLPTRGHALHWLARDGVEYVEKSLAGQLQQNANTTP